MSFTEEEILDRLEELQDAISMPSVVWDLLLVRLCPDSKRTPPLPDEPTTVMPGTVEKLEVMAARYRSGRHIFHPEDTLWDGSTDRLSITATVLRNGLLQRMVMADVEKQTHKGRRRANPAARPAAHQRPHPVSDSRTGGEFPHLRVRPSRKNKACSTAAGCRQGLLWEDQVA